MVDGPRGVPIEKTIRDRKKAALVGAILHPDPVGEMEREHANPLKFKGSGPMPKRFWEDWHRPLRASGTRLRDELYSREVWRDPVTKRFAKAPFKTLTKHKKSKRPGT